MSGQRAKKKGLRFLINPYKYLAGGPGFEPGLAESESAVLPLDDPPSKRPNISIGPGIVNACLCCGLEGAQHHQNDRPHQPQNRRFVEKTVKDVAAGIATLGKPRNHDDVKGLDPKHK